MSISVPVEVPGSSYVVEIGEGLLADIGDRLKNVGSMGKIALVTDSNVAQRYGIQLDTTLARAGFTVVDMTVPPGETSKDWSMAGQLVEALAAAGIGRDDAVLALGGGVVGDLAGFAAAVYLRGVGFIQVPTTLLAMVDSSVGGKTGVDLSAGKNLVGAFKQPFAVYMDTTLLGTLPEAEWASGLAEVAKSAVLDGEDFLTWVESRTEQIGARAGSVITEMVGMCVRFKAGVVARDEKEQELRECLNYGHTFGHALEKVLGFGTITHGEAVAEGMRFAARVAADRLGTHTSFVKRQDRLLLNLGLAPLEVDADVDALLAAMHADKKARAGVVRMVLAEGPGVWRCEPVPDEVVLAHLREWASSKTGE